jgi:formamidopyrimidine-DNA glycosylase
MPELPEVETVRIGLQKLLVHKTVQTVDFDWPKSFPNSKQQVDAFLLGATIIQVRRRAKVLLIDLSTNYSLVVHLKMTGQMVFRGEQYFGAGHPNDSLIGDLPDKSTRVTITFTDASKLFFNDQRKFGWMRLLPTAEIPNIDFMKKVGPEPLEPEFTKEVFVERLQRRKNTSIKAALLDQTVLAGIGNIYADESLFIAGIHPKSIVSAVPKKSLFLLHTAIVDVLKLSIEKGGSTDRNYVNAEGKKGSYISFAKVFRKENQPCPNACGGIIEKLRVAGRGTHVCVHCQKLYEKE